MRHYGSLNRENRIRTIATVCLLLVLVAARLAPKVVHIIIVLHQVDLFDGRGTVLSIISLCIVKILHFKVETLHSVALKSYS